MAGSRQALQLLNLPAFLAAAPKLDQTLASPGFQLSYGFESDLSGGHPTGAIIETPLPKVGGGQLFNFSEIASDLRRELPIALAIATAIPSGGASLLSIPLALQKINQQSLIKPKPLNTVGRVPMGFFDDIFGTDNVGDNFNAGLAPTSSFDFTGLLNAGVGLANNYFAGQRSQSVPMNLTSATLPMVVGAGGMVVRGAMTALAARLAAVGLTRASAWSLLKSQGPTALLALGLTAAEVVTVARKGSGRRRMNMCNGRALRRAQRRLTSFHNFYKKTCGMPTIRHRKKSCK
jgi:hypothetical protein